MSCKQPEGDGTVEAPVVSTVGYGTGWRPHLRAGRQARLDRLRPLEAEQPEKDGVRTGEVDLVSAPESIRSLIPFVWGAS